MFHTDADRFLFLLETEAELSAFLADAALETEAGEERPKYVTNYIGSKQKLTDWIWRSTLDDVQTAVDAFSGSVPCTRPTGWPVSLRPRLVVENRDEHQKQQTHIWTRTHG